MLKPSPKYRHLAAATDLAAIKPVLQQKLGEIWGHPVAMRHLTVRRIWRGKSACLWIEYAFSKNAEEPDKTERLFGKLLPPGEVTARWEESSQTLFLPRFSMSLSIFPFDAKLKTLSDFFGQSTSDLAPRMLSNSMHGGPLQLEGVEVLAYRPERRAVLRVKMRSPNERIQLIAKVTQPQMARTAFELSRSLESQGFGKLSADGITIPQALGCSPDGILWLEAVPDPSLDDLLKAYQSKLGCNAAALALGKLHRTAPFGLTPYTSQDELNLLAKVVGYLTEIYPQLSQSLGKVLRQVESSAPDFDGRDSVPIHRDFYDKQLLVGAERTTLIDLDTLAEGDPALDAGNFLAHLTLRALQTPDMADNLLSGRQEFIETYDAYQREDSAFWSRVKWWEGASLLRLACIYCLRPPWQMIATQLIDQLVSLREPEQVALA